MATDNILSTSGDLLALINESFMDPTADPIVLAATNVATDTAPTTVVSTVDIANTVDTADIATPAVEDDAAFKYLEGFDVISDLNDSLRISMNDVVNAPHDQARIQALIGYIKIQQQQNEELYNVIVGMNNFFGK